MLKIETRVPEGFIALDNSALIYPPTEAAFNANTFRISIDLKEAIEPERLKQAFEDLLKRCPYVNVTMKKGFFWYYLTPNPKDPIIHPEGSYPAGRFLFRENNGYLIRVLHASHRIALECFHALSDGIGVLELLKLLVERYLASGGREVSFQGDLSFDEPAQAWESSDPFQTLYDPRLPGYPSYPRAYHYKGSGSYDERVKVISARMKSSDLKGAAKLHDLTIGQYLGAVFIHSLQELQLKEGRKMRRRKPIRISVPMNLRRLFDLKTMRNFTLFAVVGIEPNRGYYSFEEIAHHVRLQTALAQDKKALLSQIRRNVAGEHALALRFVPTMLKNPFFKLLSDHLGDQQYSGVISNLGHVALPGLLEELVERMDFHLSPGLLNKVVLSVIGYKDEVVLNFSSFFTTDTELERIYCERLIHDHVPVHIASNRGGL